MNTQFGELHRDASAQSELAERFRTLYDENVDAVLAYALRRTSTAEDAADLVAETFLVAWRRCADIPPADEGRLWLYGVARRVLANHRRGEGRRVQLGQRLFLELGRQLVIPDPADEVAGTVAVRAALSRLDDGDRELLELTAWEELAPREIAVALGLSPSVVRARLTRARTRFRQVLSAPSGHEAGHEHAPPGHEQGVTPLRSAHSTVDPEEAR